jgi:predicted amidohydrolase YtcJ
MLLLKAGPLLALLMAAATVHAQQAPATVADAIYFDGTIITVNDRQPVAEAIAVRGGNILAVGTRKDIFGLRGSATTLIDLHGHTLLPGFVDGHSHFAGIVSGWEDPNLNPPPVGTVKTIADIQRVVRDYIASASIPTGVAVSASGYDDSALKERRHPTRADPLEPCKYADFVILAENPLKVDPLHIKDITVLETIKNGQTIYRRATKLAH